ncbi:MAG: PAS domain S-box protein [Deltaproteobacteria bacterium]|nr:PAS domain S-box protein [Deltaproteobacteria bacterium]
MRDEDKSKEQLIKELIELRRRNAELQQSEFNRERTEAELHTTKEYLENVIENSVDAIGIVDRTGRFLLWNRRAAEIYGYSFEELRSRTAFDLYVDPVDLERMVTRLRRNDVVREYEILMKKKDKSIVPMDISISLLKDHSGRTVGSVCVARDLSERKKAEAELKRAKEKLSRYSKSLEQQVKESTRRITSILKYTPAVVYIKDRDACYTLVNARHEELFGISKEEIRGKNDYDIFPKETAEKFRSNDLKVLSEGRSLQVEESVPQSDGVHTYLSVKFPLYDENGTTTGVCSISTDITELKKAQNQLRRLSASIITSQEKERAAIARELHDELGQALTALRMDSVWLLGRVSKTDPEASKRALDMRDLVDKTIDEIRGMALRLRPGILDDLGLIPALEWYTNEFEKRTGIECILQHMNVPDVDEVVATEAYRIAQEALTNVARHSSASHAEVKLQLENGALTLEIMDNGDGFSLADVAETEGLGLAGMRERAGLVGGALEIRSQPGRGTHVCCTIPMTDKIGVDD